jgi:uncharacterized membrane protein YfcA
MLPVPDLTLFQWILVSIAAGCVGIAKSGFPGVAYVYILTFAVLFGPRQGAGLVLPMLVVGDLLAVATFKQHADWRYIRRMLPPACIGVIAGALAMWTIRDDTVFTPLIGWIIFTLTVLQLLNMRRPTLFAGAPHTRWFAWLMGLLAGVTSMLANGAGPIIALFALAVGLPKFAFVGTNAMFFLVVNVFKLPFSWALGLIGSSSLSLNLVLVPAIGIGMLLGRWLTRIVPQRIFDALLLAFAAIAALRLLL